MNSRIPNLVGALNFRDVGGYPTIDGRRVKWNQLYRSGTTHAMTDEDLQYVFARGIRYACDLRSNSERHHQPGRLSGIANIERPAGGRRVSRVTIELLRRRSHGEAAARQ